MPLPWPDMPYPEPIAGPPSQPEAEALAAYEHVRDADLAAWEGPDQADAEPEAGG